MALLPLLCWSGSTPNPVFLASRDQFWPPTKVQRSIKVVSSCSVVERRDYHQQFWVYCFTWGVQQQVASILYLASHGKPRASIWNRSSNRRYARYQLNKASPICRLGPGASCYICFWRYSNISFDRGRFLRTLQNFHIKLKSEGTWTIWTTN